MALVRMFAGRRPRLHSFQGVLPPLPLPPLRETLRQYLASLEPLGPGGPREEAAALACAFGGAAGPRLQRWLRLRSWLLPCYLSELWEEHVHLRARGPLPVNSTYYVMDLLGPPPTRLQAARAANATFGLLRFRSLVESGELPPVLFRGALPTCSAQYGRIFDSSRIPGECVDRLWRGGDGSHVVVVRGGHFFRVLVRRGGRPLTPRELQAQFQRVLEETGGAAPTPPHSPEEALGVLTAGDRTPSRDQDPPSPQELEAEAKALLHGCCHNRWFDKSFTLVVFGGGRMGLSVEQSWGDPPVVGHLWEFTLAMDVLELGYEQSGDCRGGVAPGLPPPQRLHWEIPEECRGALGAALRAAQALADDLELHVFVAPPGPPRGSPDALVQLALQLALLRERGPCLTYEAVPTRLFLEGRTEGVRGCTPESLALAAAMGDPKVGRARRRALLRAAEGRLRALRGAAMTGAGLERHLQGLAAAARELGLSPPFLAQALGLPWAMASSRAPRAQPPLLPPELLPAGGGFGPPHADGYGVSFAVGADGAVIFHVSCKASSPRTDAHRFAGLIRTALLELGELEGGE